MTTFPNEENYDEQVTRYLAGELDPAEEAEFLASVAIDPDRKDLLDLMSDGWKKAGHSYTAADAERFLVRLRPHLAPNGAKELSPDAPLLPGRRGLSPFSRTRRWNIPFVRNIAIGVTAVAALFFAAQHTLDRSEPASYFRGATVHSTENGQRATVTLPDGSTVILNVASRLEVPENFGTETRLVRLTGQAMFVVNHHRGVPFIVETQRQTTQVLGTTFVVREYNTDTLSTVAVREGKVMVSSTVLTPLQQAKVDGSGRVHVTIADTTQFGFATGTLNLNEVTFQDAIPDLARWYDAEIRLGDSSLGKRRMTLHSSNTSITDFVDMLEWSYGIKAVRNGRVLTLYSK
jgi:transmembrane sensor